LIDAELEYRSILLRLGRRDKSELENQLIERIAAQKSIIEQNILRDKQHLAIVNFCAGKFSVGSRLNARTSYVWIRVEPLYGSGVATFDLAIYNRDSRVLILVECKSALREPKRELDDLTRKIETTIAKKSELEVLVGDDINYLEFAFCIKAGDAPLVRPLIVSKNLPCCLWSADIFGETLILEKLKEDSLSEIKERRLHRDERLREQLVRGSQDRRSLRTVTFLPSSHMATILEELIPQLRTELDNSQADEFGLADLKNLLARELSLQNFGVEEQITLSEKVIKSALDSGLFVDMAKDVENILEKKFRLSSQTRQHRKLIEDCHKKYVEHHAKVNALERTVQEYRVKHPAIGKY